MLVSCYLVTDSMHIPDGFLETPVWLTLDVVSIPAIGYFARKLHRNADESEAPLLGVMGAFVFAAQMINFPVGIGTSGHLVGSALLTYTLGPAAAVVVMTAILALQALIFQDGGLLALGANVFNMAIIGVLTAYLPYRLMGTQWKKLSIFLGAVLSILAAACFALSELLLSGIRMPGGLVAVSLGLFLITAVIEGVITLAVMEALERLNPQWIREPASSENPVPGLLAVTAVVVASVGVLFTSSLPDGIEKLAEKAGIAGKARYLLDTPLADYQARALSSGWWSRAVAGLAGIVLIGGLGWLLGAILTRKRRA